MLMGSCFLGPTATFVGFNSVGPGGFVGSTVGSTVGSIVAVGATVLCGLTVTTNRGADSLHPPMTSATQIRNTTMKWVLLLLITLPPQVDSISTLLNYVRAAWLREVVATQHYIGLRKEQIFALNPFLSKSVVVFRQM